VYENIPRWTVMYLAQEISGLKLREIAEYLGLKRTGSIPTTIAKLKLRMENDDSLSQVVGNFKRQYYT
jgi:chromosomal replication initiation ATPase DnaA